MKRALTILALAALPVFADDPAKTTTATETAPATGAARPQTISAAPATAADSPLVAAARRSSRGKKSAHKITNANLGKYSSSSAHITTAAKQEPIVMPPPLPPSAPTPDMKHAAEREDARKAAQAGADKKKKEEAERKLKAAAAAERAEEGMYGETDADVGYGDGEQQPQTAQPKEEKKPPQG